MEPLNPLTQSVTSDAQMQIVNALREASLQLERARLQNSEPLAVVGMACRFPGASSPSEFWQLLSAGRNAIRTTPADRWDAAALTARTARQSGRITFNGGGFLDSIDQFDPKFFEIAHREARSLDPQQRLLLEIAWEALEHAGIPPSTLHKSRSGVFIGMCGGDYLLRLARQPAEEIDTYFSTGNAHGAAAGRLSYVLQWEGPCIAVDTACSSSLVSVHLASQALHANECDLALAAGVNIIASPDLSISLSQAGMLSPDGQCHTFAAGANGFVRGEGCGAVLLKRLSAARRDGDRIFCVLRGSAVNQDGRSNGLTAPNGLSQQAVILAALQTSGVPAETIDYIEAHGTGTELGDPIEMGALQAVFSDRNRPLTVGSVKANFGHLEGAAGIAGLIKVCLAMHKGTLPPQLNFDEPSRHINWSGPIEVPTQARVWSRIGNCPRRAGVSSFGFGGTNAHVIVEEAPLPTVKSETVSVVGSDRMAKFPWLKLSAKSAEALVALAKSYAVAFSDSEFTATPLAAAIHTANVGREDFAYRLLVLGNSYEELVDQLNAIARRKSIVDGLREIGTDTNLAKAPTILFSEGNRLWISDTKTQTVQPTVAAETIRCAMRYINGETIHWNDVYGLLPRRASLPTYPFQRVRCWFRDTNSAPPTAVRQFTNRSLLGQRLDLSGETIVFESNLTQFPSLAEHVLHGQTVFPAAGFLDLAVSAATTIAAENSVDQVLLPLVTDLQLERPLVWSADHPCRIQTCLTPEHSSSTECAMQICKWTLTISSRQNDGWKQHASCLVSFTPTPNTTPESWSPQGKSYEVAQHYTACRAVGLEYGPAFQGMTSVQIAGDSCDGTAWGEAELPYHIHDESAYRLHPALLDACFQCLAPLFAKDAAMWLPISVRHCQVFASPGTMPRRLHVLGRLTIEDARTRVAELLLTDHDGRLIARLEGFRVQQIGLGDTTGTQSSAKSILTIDGERLPFLGSQRTEENVTMYLRRVLAEIIDCDPSEIDEVAPLETLGLDSLMAFELLDDMKKNLAVELPQERFLAGISLSDLVRFVIDHKVDADDGDNTDDAVDGVKTAWVEGTL